MPLLRSPALHFFRPVVVSLLLSSPPCCPALRFFRPVVELPPLNSLAHSVYFWKRIRLRPHELGEGDTEYLLDIDFEIVLRFDSDPSSLLDAILVVVQTQGSEEADVTEDAALKLYD